MKLKSLFPSLLGAALLLAPGLRAAEESIAASKNIFQQWRDSVVWVSAVAKITFSSDAKLPMALPDQERKFESIATFVDASGLCVTALSTLDPTKEVSGREFNTPNGRVKLDATAILKEVKITLADGTEIPADVVMKDADLDLAFLRPKPDAKEAKGVTFAPLDLKQSAKLEPGDEIVNLGRMDEALNRQPMLARGQVMGVTQKPRVFYRVTGAAPGGPTFTPEGKLLGIAVNRSAKERAATTVILPAADVLEIAEQAKSAKPIVTEEKPGDEKPDEAEKK